jgi:hypothetical protein
VLYSQLVHFAMTKAVVRAMDAVQQISGASQFILSGASKRGWYVAWKQQALVLLSESVFRAGCLGWQLQLTNEFNRSFPSWRT